VAINTKYHTSLEVTVNNIVPTGSRKAKWYFEHPVMKYRTLDRIRQSSEHTVHLEAAVPGS